MLKAANRHLPDNVRKDQKGFVLVAAAVGFASVLEAAGLAVPVMLARVIGAQSTMHVAALATGGRLMVTTYADGLLPFSPIAPTAADKVQSCTPLSRAGRRREA